MDHPSRSVVPWIPLALLVAALSWATLIFLLLTSSDPPGYDRAISVLPTAWLGGVAHFALFAVLAAILAVLGLTRKSTKQYFVWSAAGALLLSAAYGGALELYQSTLPARAATWTDASVNAVGALFGAFSGAMFARGFFRWYSRS